VLRVAWAKWFCFVVEFSRGYYIKMSMQRVYEKGMARMEMGKPAIPEEKQRESNVMRMNAKQQVFLYCLFLRI